MNPARRGAPRAPLSIIGDEYTLEKCLGQGAQSEVWAAVRVSDGRAVVLKAYATDRGKPLADTWAQVERTLLRAAAGKGIPALLELVAQDPPVLVLERVPGLPLAEWIQSQPLPDIRAFLVIALQLCDALASIHAAHLIHRDVTPENIIIEPVTLRVHLIDFSIAQRLGAAARRSASQKPEFVGTPRYVAPEQTGWLNRGCDSRSDLYSLGATLYHLLTGRPPFEGSAAVELLHAHIARVPRPPVEIRPDVPDAVGRVLLKLLRKEPDERYRSARTLQLDLLALREHIDMYGRIDAGVELASDETPERPHFTRKMHGRERELEQLERLYARAAEGEMQAVIIRGEPGVGKSTLVDALRPRIAENRGYFALGKFERDRERPYSAWVSILESLVQQILVESDARLSRWSEELRAGLGSIAQALVELVPDLSLIVGEVPPVPALGAGATQARLALALERFLRVCARPERPLAIFIDDLQWSDAGSLALLEELLSSERNRCILWIGALRSGAGEASHALEAMLERLTLRDVILERLELRALTHESVLTLLSEALARSPQEVGSLAALIERKTANVPLLVRQFVEHIHEQGFLLYQPDVGWTWDAAQIAASDVPDGAVALMTAKIARLGPELRAVLEFASCVGPQFDVDLLCELERGERSKVVQQLYELCDAGLLAPCSVGFRFAHDRIREAAQSLLSDAQRQRVHYETGRLMLARTPEAAHAQRAFEIVGHLNLALPLVEGGLRTTLIRLNFAAGGSAMSAGAGATAASHFAVARGLFEPEDWTRDPALAYALHLHSVESAFQCGELTQALELLDVLDARPLSRLELTRVAVQRSRVFALTREPEECVTYMLSVLRRFGVRFPLHPSRLRAWLAMRGLQLRLAARGDGAEMPPATGTDRDWIAPLLIYGANPGVQIRVDVHLGILTNCDALRRMIRHGRVFSPSYSFAAFASSWYLQLGDAKGALRFADVALGWNQREPDPLRGPRTEFHLHSALYPWLMPRRKPLALLPRFAEAIRELGDPEYANYARMLGSTLLALAGDAVPEVVERMRRLADGVTRSRHRYPAPAECHAVTQLLLDPGSTPFEELLEASDKRLAGDSRSAEPYVRTLWMLVLCVYGRHDLALAQSNAIGERLFRVVPYVHLADHTFLRGLASAALAASATGRTAWRLRRDLRRCRRRLRQWAKHGPDFVHMETLLHAELAQLCGDHERARALFEQGAQRALEQEFPHHAALAHERHARMLAALRRETESSANFAQAISLYRAWGAEAKASQLARERRSIK